MASDWMSSNASEGFIKMAKSDLLKNAFFPKKPNHGRNNFVFIRTGQL